MKEAEEDWGKGQTEEGKRQTPSRVILNRNMDPQKIAAFGAFLIREASKQSRWGLGGCKKSLASALRRSATLRPQENQAQATFCTEKEEKALNFGLCVVFLVISRRWGLAHAPPRSAPAVSSLPADFLFFQTYSRSDRRLYLLQMRICDFSSSDGWRRMV